MSTASPEGVLRFATHCMGRHFVRSSADLEKRLKAAQCRPAFDGRYELQEYPCFDDTWRPTMERLAAVADVILVVVRGYTPTRLGTTFELATVKRTANLTVPALRSVQFAFPKDRSNTRRAPLRTSG